MQYSIEQVPFSLNLPINFFRFHIDQRVDYKIRKSMKHQSQKISNYDEKKFFWPYFGNFGIEEIDKKQKTVGGS